MMRWLPRIRLGGWTGAHAEAQYEGRYLSLTWGRLHVELSCGVAP